jgi:hypothetical protein
MPNESEARLAVEKVMKANIRTFVLITMREVDGGERMDVAYQVRLSRKHPAAEVLSALSSIEGVSDVNFMMQDAVTEM